MKQKDLLLIGIAIVASAILSIVVSNKIFTTPADRQQQVEVAGSISPTFTSPSSMYFNSNSIDSTQSIQIGVNSNQTPFGSGSQTSN
jgi:hypothetical protein